MHLTRGRALWTAGITGCCTVAGLAAAPLPARAALAAEVPFTCATEVGVHKVTARVAARTPARAAAGGVVRLGTVSLDLTVPDALRKEMLRGTRAATPIGLAASGVEDGPARVSGVASLSVVVSGAGQAAVTNWPVIHVRGDDPGSGPLRLKGDGTASGVVAPTQGSVSWTAARLAFALTVDVDGTTASSPAMVCSPERRIVLGTVPVTGSGRRAGSPLGAQTAAAGPAKLPECIRVPDYKTDPAWDFNEDPRLRNVFESPSLPDPQDPTKWVENPADPSRRRGVPYCIRAAGFANVKKVGAATPVAAMTLLRRAVYGIAADRAGGNTANYFQQRGYFNTEAMPSNASVLSFGFMPTTATALVQQVAPPGSNGLTTGNIRSDIALNAGLPGATRNGKELGDETWARSFVQMSVAKASVNGLTIDLGKGCGTAPTLLDLNTFTGDYRTGRLSITEGSALTGHLEIPKFSHCGVTEDLSPLLTASISGPGNYVQIESGPWCNTNVSTDKCDETTEPRTWTVTPGGTLTMTQSPLVLSGDDGTGAEIRCDSLVMKANLREGHWNSRFVIGKIDGVRFNGCTRRSGGQESPAKLTPVGTPWALNLLGLNSDGTVVAQISRIFFNAEVARGCVVRFGAGDANLPVEKAGKVLGNYDNATHAYTVTGDGQLKVNGTECPVPPTGFEVGARYSVQGGPFVFDPAQKITQP